MLAFGVNRITEEQFGASYLRAIQTATQESGAIHETTAGVWWPENLSRGEFVFLRDTNATAVPAVSTWGSWVMTLLVLTVGTVVLRRRYGVL